MSRKGNLLADAGLMMGRSCRVGWGPNGMLAVCGTICDFESVKERYVLFLDELFAIALTRVFLI